MCFFFFSSRRRHTRCSRDWSSDVCSSDLSQRFWDAMNAVDESAIRKIEMQLSRQLVEDFGIDVRCLCFDRSEEHTSELQSRLHLVCRLLLEKKNTQASVASAENEHDF